jgi:aryl-alcohol dehydrogenase-like predicted oxidoreductase
MKYRNLGNTGVQVSEVCLGTAFRGQDDERQCVRIMDRAIDQGCNFIDSAFYGEGRAETVVGKAIGNKREQVVLCTKVFGTRYPDVNRAGLTRLNLLRGIEDSLTRLKTEYIDVYLLHSFDPVTPLEETLRTLDDLVRSGKVRYIGCSNFRAWKVVEALWTSDRQNLAHFTCIQDQYNLLNRWELEPDLMPLCQQHGLGIMTYSPLAIGLLTGQFRRGQAPPAGNHLWSKEEGRGFSAHKYDLEAAMTQRVDQIVQALIEVGARHERTPGQVAIAWILDHPEVTAPILGADRPEQVDEAFAALDWSLPAEERVILDRVSEVQSPAKWA